MLVELLPPSGRSCFTLWLFSVDLLFGRLGRSASRLVQIFIDQSWTQHQLLLSCIYIFQIRFLVGRNCNYPGRRPDLFTGDYSQSLQLKFHYSLFKVQAQASSSPHGVYFTFFQIYSYLVHLLVNATDIDSLYAANNSLCLYLCSIGRTWI